MKCKQKGDKHSGKDGASVMLGPTSFVCCVEGQLTWLIGLGLYNENKYCVSTLVWFYY